MSRNITATIIVVSDSVAAGKSEDKSGALLCERLASFDVECKPVVVVPDEIAKIRGAATDAASDIVALTGGTGVGPRDVTPEAIRPLIEKQLEGVEQAIRIAGMIHTPRAMLSRVLVGTAGKKLFLCLPGAPAAVDDAITATFPTVLHVFDVLEERPH